MNAALSTIYPVNHSARNRWIVERRPARNTLDPLRPYAFFLEEERSATGDILPLATIFLTNKECPWRCLMCDLWRNTLTTTLPPRAIPTQIAYALNQLPPTRQIKLYNSGSFFDPSAIPVADYDEIARQSSGFDRVIVESHPSLVGANCLSFNQRIAGQLEVAIGLETAHPQTLERLNKQMSLDQFSAAADFLQKHNIDLRVFILVKPPFMREEEGLEWAMRSLDFAFRCGATAATLIATRPGNGALDELASRGDFAPPTLGTIESALAYGLSCRQGRVFVDLWELKTSNPCPACFERRVHRLREINLTQVDLPQITCDSCGASS